MSSIGSISSVSSALPSSGLSRIRQMLASDAAAVQPVRRVPGDQERQKQQQSNDVEATDEALQGSGGASAAGSRTARQADSSSVFAPPASGSTDSPVSAGLTALTTTPNAGFVAQSIHQDAMGSGLHIEPWNTAIQAYRRASTGPDTGAMLSTVVA